MKYVRWTADEKSLIADRVHALTIKHGYKVPYEPGVLLSLVREAQAAFPAVRQKDIATTASVIWVEDMVLDRMTRPVSVKKDELPIVAVIPKDKIEEKLKNSQSVWELIKSEVRKTPIIETLIESVAEQIVDDIIASVTAKLLDRGMSVGEVIEKQPSQVTTPAPAVEETPANQKPPRAIKKPKIVVIGLLGRHFTLLKQEFGKTFDLVALDSDELKKSKICETADMTLLMKKFISHKHSEKVSSQTTKFEYIDGGMTELRHRLEKFAATLTEV